MAVRHIGMLALTFMVSSCGRSPSAPARPTPVAPAVSTANVRPPKPTAMRDDEARALVDAWVAAQNVGDFAAYEGLYAARFSGVRRNAERARSFDRAGWLRDRRRMFGRAITVTVRDVDVQVGTSTAEVRLIQRFASGTYADEGPKRLVLVREGGAVRISVEEMLSASALGELDSALTQGLFFAMPGDRGPVAVIAAAEQSLGDGAPRFAGSDDPLIVTRPLTHPPKSLESRIGGPITVIERARACEATVRAVSVARVVSVHAATLDAWEGRGLDDAADPVPAADRAREAWDMGTHTFYVAELDSECTEVVAATTAPLAAVEVHVPSVPTAVERASLLRAFERTSRFRAHERAYSEFLAEGLADEEHPAPPAQRAAWEADSSVVLFSNGVTRHATVVHNAEGCGGFDESAWAAFTLSPRPTEIAEDRSLGDYVSVMALFDVDRDGALEAVVRQGVGGYGLVRIAPRIAPIRMFDFDFLDCRC